MKKLSKLQKELENQMPDEIQLIRQFYFQEIEKKEVKNGQRVNS